jgi:hypothetical protein
MNNKYIQVTPTKVFAVNLKAASESIIRGIINAYYPETFDKIHLPEGRTIEDVHVHGYVTRTAKPQGDTTLVVRDPVERFRSAVATVGDTDLDVVLAKLENDERVNRHYLPTSRLLVDGCKLFRFETDLDDVAAELGITLGAGRSFGIKPDLTPEQLARVQAIYADDIALHESITEAGQIWQAPATDDAKAEKIAELERARWDAEVSGITLPDGREVLTDKETQAELGKALSTIATINPALEIDWKFPSGEVVELDAAHVQQIAGAVFTHVQSTRSAFKDKAAQVQAASTQLELDAINW